MAESNPLGIGHADAHDWRGILDDAVRRAGHQPAPPGQTPTPAPPTACPPSKSFDHPYGP